VAKLQSISSPAADVVEVSIPDTMRTLYTRRVTILVTLAIFLVLGGLFALLPSRYKAEGTLWVEPGESSAYEISALTSMISGQTSDIVASETLALTSRTLLLRVAKELDLVHQRAFWGPIPLAEPSPEDRTLENAYTRDIVYKQMNHILDVDNDGKDEIITIDVTTISPQLSAKIVNTLINDYLEYLFEMRYGATKRSSAWLVDQLGSLKQQVDTDQVELNQLQEKLGVVGVSPGTGNYIYGDSLSDLMKASDDATVERIVAEAKYRYLKESNPNLIEGEIQVLPAPQQPTPGSSQSLLATLRIAQGQSAAAYARMLSMYGPNYPEVQQQKASLDELNQEVSTEQQRILNQAQLSYQAASENEKMTSEKVQGAKSKVFDSRSDMVRFVLLMQDYQSDKALYEGLIQHLQEAGITSGLQAGDIDVVDLADVPGKPKAPNAVLTMILAVIGGLIIGCFMALWLASMDRRILGPEQVEKLTGLPLLAQVPHVKFNKGAASKTELPHLIITARRSHYAEALQSLRASLLLAKPGSAPKTILVTSATPNEGKSITVVNLAATFARHGARVLVADCDLRRGTVAQRLRLSAARGVTSVLTRQMSLDSAMQELPGVPGLFVLADGPRPPDPAVLIGSDEMRRLVETCREEFDFVIIDSPPILGIADGLHLGQLVDSVVLVIRESVSNRKAVEDTVAMMAASHLPVSGFIFNDVDPRASRYGYGYTYRDYYRGYYTDTPDGPPAEVTQ
jgi:polysaccharide biosynthesis transport protein